MKRIIASAIATASLLLYSFATPIFAATTIEITGNGADSNSDVQLNTTQTTTVVQSNNADIDNNVDAEAETGDNEANENTGGDVSIDTGDATTDVNIDNQANMNVADVDCNTCNGSTDVTISGNGADSHNDVHLDKTNTVDVFQENNARIDNYVDAEAETGDNEANENTGGDVEILTGDAETTVSISNMANANLAIVGGNDDENSGSASVQIIGNGADSHNDIHLDLDRSVTVVQDNDADIDNNVDAEAETGDNEANENTNGDVTIDTGDATVDVEIDNLANFNAADVDCCLFDVLAKVSGNGADTHNKIHADLGNDLSIFQDNCGKENYELSYNDHNGYHKCGIDNDLDTESDTGDNEVDENTASAGSDPEVTTGDAENTTSITNFANENIVGDFSDFDLPEVDFDFDFDFHFDLSDLLGMLHLG